MWFPGDHGSVGGGGSIHGLSDIALHWVLDGAKDAGLNLQTKCPSPVFKALNPLAPLKNTPPPKWYDWKTRAINAAINIMGLSDRRGPECFYEVHQSAKVRFDCPREYLPEKEPYRPGSLKRLESCLHSRSGLLYEDFPKLVELTSLLSDCENDKKITLDGRDYIIYTVRKGDTLCGIADRYLEEGSMCRVVVDARRATIENPDRIFVRKRILIPVEKLKPELRLLHNC